MSSCCASKFKRNFLFKLPFLYKKCPDGNYHIFYARYCYCRVNEHIISDDPRKNWYGGVYDFKRKTEIKWFVNRAAKEKDDRPS